MYWKSGNVETIGDITSTLRTIKVTSNNFFELTNASIYDGNNLIEQKVATNSNVISSNPQPIGFRENLLVKRPKFFYCTYSLGITETS